jgi:hypothetical protein
MDHVMTDQSPDGGSDPTTLAPGAIAARLANWADGLTFERHAVALLIAHGWWLRHDGFLTECVFLIEPDDAAVDWLAIPRFLAGIDAAPLDTDVLTVARRLAQLQRGVRDHRAERPIDPLSEIGRLLTDAVGPDVAHPLLTGRG